MRMCLRPSCALASGCWSGSGKRRRRGMGAQNTTAREERELERTAKTKMGARLESGNGAATELQEPRRVKTTGDRKQRIPRWGIFLFATLAAYANTRTLQPGLEMAT